LRKTRIFHRFNVAEPGEKKQVGRVKQIESELMPSSRSVTSGDSTALEAASVEAANEPICRYEKETGSMMRKRVCRTRAEIDEARTKSQQVLKELDESGIAINTD